MLRQRLLTALVLMALFLAAVFLLPPLAFKLGLAGVMLVGAFEWARLAGLQSLPGCTAYTVMFAGLLWLSAVMPQGWQLLLLWLGLLWWTMAFVLILVYPKGSAYWGSRFGLGLAGLLVLLPGWLCFVLLRSEQRFPFLIILLVLLVAATDSGAYFAGRRWGRRKLAPAVSPNKTWEGFWGGMLSCCALLALTSGSGLSPTQWLMLGLFGMLLGASSVVGDLLESMVKRHRGVKDSGRILPGHGGILDRIDGVTAAAPLYALMILMGGEVLL